MIFSKKDIEWTAVFRFLIWAGVLLYVFSRFIPCATVGDYPKSDGLDDAWTQALHLAFSEHWQFGTAVVFTYGPWGFLARGYYPPTYLIAMMSWTVLSLVFLGASWRLARHFFKNEWPSVIWLVGFTAAATIPAGEDFNNRLVAWGVLLLGLHFFVEEGAFSLLQAALTISLGWMSLVKFTGLTESVVIVGVIAADNLFRQRRFPWIVPVWGAGLLFFWFAAGQQVRLLLPFLSNSWQITSGYTEAMMLAGPTEFRDAIGFLLTAGLIGALIGRLVWLRHQKAGVLPLAGLAMILFIVFKLGFVRNGWQHASTAAMALVLIALVGLALAQTATKITRQAAAGGLVLTLVYAAVVFNCWLPGEGLGKQLVESFSLHSLFAPVAASVTGDLRSTYEKKLTDGRRDFPLPPIPGRVDLYSYGQTILFANGLAYAPRPVMQSYSAYTPALARLNASYLRSARAPDNLLFAVQTIDDRFPSLDDGLSWPVLLTRYDPKSLLGKQGGFLLLSRSANPRSFQMIPLQTLSARFGEPVAVPAMSNNPLWAEIEINKSVVGRMALLFYKPPELRLTVILKNRSQQSFRLVPGQASGGFLLSPLIADTKAFAALAGSSWRQDLAGAEVVSMVISADTKSGSTVCYRSPMDVRFYRFTQSASGLR